MLEKLCYLYHISNDFDNKKKRYNSFRRKKERYSYGSHMDSFYPFYSYILCKLRKEDKRIEQTYQTIRKTSERK